MSFDPSLPDSVHGQLVKTFIIRNNKCSSHFCHKEHSFIPHDLAVNTDERKLYEFCNNHKSAS
jgi:hypothetical protein